VLKKAILFFILVVVALLLDGTLSYDIFDLRMLSFTGWLALLLVVIMCGTIGWADSAKKNKKESKLR
jgi:hypothetical protein